MSADPLPMGFCHYPRPAGWPHCQRERVSLGSSVVNGDRSFQCVVVHICHLRTCSSNPPIVSALPAEPPRVIGPANVVLPPVDATPIISSSPTRFVLIMQLLILVIIGEPTM